MKQVKMRYWQKIFIFWFTLLPFVKWGSIYEGAKVFDFWLGSFFWLVVLRQKLAKLITKADLWYFGWLLSLFVASLFGVHPLESIIGGSYRHQGVIFFVGLWLVGKSISILSTENKALLKKGIILGVLLESLVIFYQVLSNQFLVNNRPLGTFGEPNAAAGFLVIASLFAVTNFALLAVVFLAILLTTSRTALVAFPLAFLLKLKNRKYFILALFVFLILGLGAKNFILAREISPFENRKLFYELALEAFKKKPFLGYGAESGEVIYDFEFEHTAGIPLFGLVVERSHNLILDLLLWSGIPGLLFFSLWFWEKFKEMEKNPAKISALGAWIVFSFLQPLGVVHWALLMLIISY